jgi:hypothetical protein
MHANYLQGKFLAKRRTIVPIKRQKHRKKKRVNLGDGDNRSAFPIRLPGRLHLNHPVSAHCDSARE